MKIEKKLKLALLTLVIFTTVVGVMAYFQTRKIIYNSFEELHRVQAVTIVEEIDRLLHNRVAIWRAYAETNKVQMKLTESNLFYANLENLEEDINQKEKEWLRSPNDSTFIETILNTPLSKDMLKMINIFTEEKNFKVFGEVFLTNRYGVNVSQSHLTTDFIQSDELWWQMAMKNGTYIGDVAYDKSSQLYSVDLCFKILNKEKEPIGVLKAVLNIQEIIDVIESKFEHPQSHVYNILLLNKDRKVIYDYLNKNDILSRLVNYDLDLNSETKTSHFSRGSEKYIAIPAESSGYHCSPGLEWTVLIELSAREVFGHIDFSYLILSSILALIFFSILTTWYFLSQSVHRNIKVLNEATNEIMKNNYSYRVCINDSYEFKMIGKVFNEMVKKIEINSNEQEEKRQLITKYAEEIKIANEEMFLLKEKADKANVAKSRFLANMSHEIRTPINAIVGLTQLSLKNETKPQQIHYLEKINESSDLLMMIINEILDFSKIEAGKMTLELIPLKLHDIMVPLVDLMKVRLKNCDIEPIFNCPINYPIIGDQLRLTQILSNLISNAMKFTTKGEIKLTVSEQTRDEKNISLKFEVSDTGLGIKKEQSKSLFEAFQQADISTTREHGGTGLGLKITQQLLKMMGSEIYVDSKYGEGSKFYFTIEFPIDCSSNEQGFEVEKLKNLNLAVVEPSKQQCQAIIDIFKSVNIKVRSFCEIEDIPSNFKADYVICPNGTPLNIPMIETSHPCMQNRDVKKEKLSKGHITKPILAPILLDKILKLVDDTKKQKNKSVLKCELPSYPKAKLLLTDDNELNRFVIIEMLKDINIHPDIAVNGKEAVELCEKTKYDLILMDIQMPVMDGIEATNLIHSDSRNKKVPIIGITADALLGQAEHYIKQGLDDLITKPFHHHRLQQVLLKWLPHLEEKLSTNLKSVSKKLQNTSIQHVDIEEGIKYANNNQEHYLHVIYKFCNNYSEIGERIKNYFMEEEWSDLFREIHSLKGLAKLIGAHELSDLAQKLNQKLKNQDDEAYQIDSYNELENKLQAVLSELNEILNI
ncbi:ATP-binding protein [Lentisphaera marina]|uniref:HAMP domain-containing sensor histidine kinase n=1 Tax=Lentisphaera marina TaxID=1111041 RepID=UPI0023672313|nr:ATP-binding protein [Lentisphaera marina]MDD7983938.1 ATP-binding protein [Lentisphaera marina]